MISANARESAAEVRGEKPRKIRGKRENRRHAGENLAEVLKRRAAELPPPIQRCDALSRNLPGELQTILAHCLGYARRQFVEVYEHFPEPCRYLLESSIATSPPGTAGRAR